MIGEELLLTSDIRIYYDKEKTKEVEEKLWTRYGNEEKEWAESGYHVSECTYCELKCFNRRIGIKQKVTKKAIGFLIFGIVAEEIVMSIYPTEQCQCEAKLADMVVGHLDAFENFEHPIEGKATAKRIFKREQIPIYWIMQLINYITMTDKTKGWLYILDIWTRTFSAWAVELSNEAKQMQIIVLTDKVARLNKAIETGDTSELKIAPEEFEMCLYKKDCSKVVECRREHKILKAKKDAEKIAAKKFRGK